MLVRQNTHAAVPETVHPCFLCTPGDVLRLTHIATYSGYASMWLATQSLPSIAPGGDMIEKLKERDVISILTLATSIILIPIIMIIVIVVIITITFTL